MDLNTMMMQMARAGSAHRHHTADHAANTNADATITYAADPDRRHCIRGLEWGYDGVPTGGFVRVQVAGLTVFYIPVTTGGAGISPNLFRTTKLGQAMTITIGGGGAGITGHINVDNYWWENH